MKSLLCEGENFEDTIMLWAVLLELDTLEKELPSDMDSLSSNMKEETKQIPAQYDECVGKR